MESFPGVGTQIQETELLAWSGGESENTEETDNQYGHVLTSYSAVYDNDGNVTALVAADVSMDDAFRTMFGRYRVMIAAVVISFVFVPGILAVILKISVLKPAETISSRMKKVAVHKNDGTRQTAGDNENNGYLTRVGYRDREITIDMFHGINDGIGTMPFLKTLLYYYCEKKYGIDNGKLTDLILADTPEDPREYADCMLFLPEEDVKPEGKYTYKEAFYLPDEQMKSPWECKHYQLKVDASDLKRYMHLHDTSVSALFTLFVNKVIAGFNDRKGLPIVGAMAVNARPAYKAEKTMQCCVATIPVYYDDAMENMELSEQLKQTRKIVMQDQYFINYMTHLENDRYIYALKDLLLCEGLSCEMVQRENFAECIAQFEHMD